MPRQNKESYNEYMRSYMAQRHKDRRRVAIKKLGGKCSKCGSKRRLRLEFDHIDPATKEQTIARIWSYSEERFWAEVEKCQLLCRTCHDEKTLDDLDKSKAKGVHGTLTNYRRHGCRCRRCKDAQAEAMREYRQRKK